MHQGGLRVSGCFPDFSALNATIVGVSKDTVTKHDKFKAKYELPFHLASDEDGSYVRLTAHGLRNRCMVKNIWV